MQSFVEAEERSPDGDRLREKAARLEGLRRVVRDLVAAIGLGLSPRGHGVLTIRAEELEVLRPGLRVVVRRLFSASLVRALDEMLRTKAKEIDLHVPKRRTRVGVLRRARRRAVKLEETRNVGR